MKTTCKVSFEAHDSDGHFQSIRISVVFHVLSFWEELSGTPWAHPVPGGRLCPCPKSERVRMTQVSTDTHFALTPKDIRWRLPTSNSSQRGGKINKQKRPNQNKKNQKQNKTKRTRDSKFHCDHTTAKYTFCSLQKTREGQIKAGKKYVAWVTVQPYYSFFLYFPPPHLVQFRKRIEYNTVR